jgi:glucose-1-phosphate adenylyltransferase
LSYIEHGSTWDLDVNEGGISFLTPYTSANGELWQKGTAHSVYQHLRFVDQYNPDFVLILSGDHVYKMDYNLMINEHIKNKADITISTFKVHDNPSRYGILELNELNQVVSFEEKPINPKSDLASMGIYVFNTKVLHQLLQTKEEKIFDFGNDIIPLAIKKQLSIFGYRFDGYFRDVGTVESLYQSNMDLIDNPHYLKIHDYNDFPILTKSSNLPPHHIVRSKKITNSLISDGCLIYGEINHSILSSGVLVSDQSIIKDSIVHANVKIGKNCQIERAIIVEDSVILANTVLKFDEITVVDNEYLWKMGEHHE